MNQHKRKIAIGLAAVVVVAVLIWLPRKLWLAHIQSRFEATQAQLSSCGLSCVDQVNGELDGLIKEMNNPPWYVWGVPRLKAKSGTQQPAAAPASAAAEPKHTEWRRYESKSEMDGTATVALQLDAEDAIRGPVKRQTPTLLLRCRGDKHLDAYIHTGMAASVEYSTSSHTVRLKFDDGPPAAQHWGESDTSDALFYEGDATALMDRLRSTKIFKFEFTPFDEVAQVATFHVNDLAEAQGQKDFCPGAFESAAKADAANKALRAKLVKYVHPCDNQELGKWCWSDPDNALWNSDSGYSATKDAALNDAMRSARLFGLFKKN